MPPFKVTKNTKRDDRERRIGLAMALANEKVGNKRKVSIREAAIAFNIPKSTLADRIAGRRSHMVAHRDQQKLSEMDEKAVLRWIKRVESQGFPPRIEHVRQAAERLAGGAEKIGKHWISRFLRRHHSLAVKLSVQLDYKRIKASHPMIIQDHFNKLTKVIKTHSLQPSQIYNMDEKGFLMGVSERSRVVYTSGVIPLGQSAFPIPDDGNRESLTVIETVCAGGYVLPPLIIFKGANHYMGCHQFTGGQESKNFQFSYSLKGYTSRTLSMEWLQKVFHPHTLEKNTGASKHRLLIVDGHDSHVHLDFLEFCSKNDIILFCLPPHSTHLLQPLDVGLFGPLQHYYGQAVDKVVRSGNQGIRKGNFLPLYLQARESAYTVKNIHSAFVKCGIVPLNARKVLGILPGATEKTGRATYQEGASTGKKSEQMPPPTPESTRAISHMVRKATLQLRNEEAVPSEMADLLESMHRFAIAREKDSILIEKTFEEWKQAHKLNVKKDLRRLATGKQLARVLDGATIQQLYREREEKDKKQTNTIESQAVQPCTKTKQPSRRKTKQPLSSTNNSPTLLTATAPLPSAIPNASSSSIPASTSTPISISLSSTPLLRPSPPIPPSPPSPSSNTSPNYPSTTPSAPSASVFLSPPLALCLNRTSNSSLYKAASSAKSKTHPADTTPTSPLRPSPSAIHSLDLSAQPSVHPAIVQATVAQLPARLLRVRKPSAKQQQALEDATRKRK